MTINISVKKINPNEVKCLVLFHTGLKILRFLHRAVPVQVRPGAPDQRIQTLTKLCPAFSHSTKVVLSCVSEHGLKHYDTSVFSEALGLFSRRTLYGA